MSNMLKRFNTHIAQARSTLGLAAHVLKRFNVREQLRRPPPTHTDYLHRKPRPARGFAHLGIGILNREWL